MENIFQSDLDKTPYLIVNDGEVIEISQSFVDFTEFTSEELLYKNISEIFRMLKIFPEINCENINDKEYFLLTKAFELRFINIFFEKSMEEEIYYFSEVLNSRVNDKFYAIESLIKDDYIGVAIFSMPDIILIKANETFISNFVAPYNIIENAIGKSIEELLPAYKGSVFEEILDTVLQTGKPYYLNEHYFEGFRNEAMYWDNTIIPIYEEARLKYCIQTVRNVTDRVLNRKKIEEQTKIIDQQKKQFEAVLENMSSGCIIFDRYKNIIKMNKVIREWFPGLIAENLNSLLGYICCLDLESKQLDYEELPSTRAINGQSVQQFEISVKNGQEERFVNISSSPIYDDEGNFIIGVINAQDITEQTKHRNELKIQNDYMYTMIDILNLPLIRVSYPELNIIGTNMKGYEFIIAAASGDIHNLGNIVGQNIYTINLNIKFNTLNKSINKMIKNSDSVFLKDIKIILEDKTYYYNLILQPMSIIDTKLNEFMIIFVDITDEIIQKQAIEKVMKMQEEFFIYITHEFKTPLTAMSSTIQFMELLYSSEMNDNIKKNVNRLKRSTYQQLRLVNNLLDIIKAESGYLKVYENNFDIAQLTKAITESIFEFAEAKNIKIEFDFLVKDTFIAIDDEKYERILLNLLSNAIKYTPRGKHITISIYSDERNVYIAVKDEGVGIPKDKYEIIFERFGQIGSSLTRYSEGTGIGLCLVRLLARAMDGDITFTSEEGVGTTFIINLPNIKLKEDGKARLPELIEGRLIRTMNVEFSNIYLN